MRVIHEVPAPRDPASMFRSFLYFHTCQVSVFLLGRQSEGGDEPGWLDRSEGVSWNSSASEGVITSSWLDIVADFLVSLSQVYRIDWFLDCVARLVVLTS